MSCSPFSRRAKAITLACGSQAGSESTTPERFEPSEADTAAAPGAGTATALTFVASVEGPAASASMLDFVRGPAHSPVPGTVGIGPEAEGFADGEPEAAADSDG